MSENALHPGGELILGWAEEMPDIEVEKYVDGYSFALAGIPHSHGWALLDTNKGTFRLHPDVLVRHLDRRQRRIVSNTYAHTYLWRRGTGGTDGEPPMTLAEVRGRWAQMRSHLNLMVKSVRTH